MKNNLLGKNFLSCSFYLYRFRKYVSCGFPIINFCNPGVHYETPCIIRQNECTDTTYTGVGQKNPIKLEHLILWSSVCVPFSYLEDCGFKITKRRPAIMFSCFSLVSSGKNSDQATTVPSTTFSLHCYP